MPKYIVSQSAITRCIESRSSRLPTTTSAPMSRNACARSSSVRTIARTALPCFNNSSVTVRPTAPTRPAAPVTRMGAAMFLLLVHSHRKCAVNATVNQVHCGSSVPPLRSRLVSGVPTGPVGVALAEVLLVLAVGSLGTPHCARQVICRAERSHASIDATGQSRRDFLQQPTVAIGIAERSQRAVGAPLRIWTADRTVRTEVEDLANGDT